MEPSPVSTASSGLSTEVSPDYPDGVKASASSPEFRQHLLEQWGMPTPEWKATADAAYLDLVGILTHSISNSQRTPSRPWLTLFPYGNFACGIYSEVQDLECSAVGSIHESLFVEFVWQNIAEAQARGVKVIPFEVGTINENGTMVVVLEVSGISFRVNYNECQTVVEGDQSLLELPPTLHETLPLGIQITIDDIKDFNECMELAASVNPDFYTLYYFLVSWAKLVGLYFYPRMDGTVSNRNIRTLCRQAIMLHQHGTHTDGGQSLLQLSDEFRNILRNSFHPFFRREVDALCAALDQNSSSAKNPFDIRNMLNIYQSLQVTHQSLVKTTDAEMCVQLSMLYTGQSQVECANRIKLAEASVHYVYQHLRSTLFGHCHLWLWPSRLVSNSTVPGAMPYECSWMISISRHGNLGSALRLQTQGDKLRDMVNKEMEDSYYCSDDGVHPKPAVSPHLISASDAESMMLTEDLYHWPRTPAEAPPSIRLDRLESSSPSAVLKAPQSSPSSSLPTPKLRPSMDVLSRIRHDTSLDLDDYLVGYEDRHVGIMWKAAADWVKETTDENWIPQDRIRFFKRKSDGVLVWDRAAKKDLIFASA